MKTKLDWELTIDEFTEEHGSLSPPLFIYLCWNVSEIFSPANPKIIDYLNLEAGKQEHASLSRQNGSKQEQMEAVPRHHCKFNIMWTVRSLYLLDFAWKKAKPQRTSRNVFLISPQLLEQRRGSSQSRSFFRGGGGGVVSGSIPPTGGCTLTDTTIPPSFEISWVRHWHMRFGPRQ